jgi:hypothetical protein
VLVVLEKECLPGLNPDAALPVYSAGASRFVVAAWSRLGELEMRYGTVMFGSAGSAVCGRGDVAPPLYLSLIYQWH